MKGLTEVRFVLNAVKSSSVNTFTTQQNCKNCIQYYSYISTSINTINIIVIRFNIPHFQLLLICVVLSCHYARK
jgi:hypothetical protein